MPRGFYLEGERDAMFERERTGLDIMPRRRFQPLPDTLTASSRRTIEAAGRARRTQATAPPTPIPTNPQPPLPSEGGPAPGEPDMFTTVGGPTLPPPGGFGGGSLPTFGGSGFTGSGGGGFSIGDQLSGALGGLINRGAAELGDRLFGGSEPPSGEAVVPGTGFTVPEGGNGGTCPGVGSIRVAGRCVNLGDLGPGGAPAVTPQVGGDWNPVAGLYGVGVTPMVEERIHRSCPPGYVLGKDGVCYDGLAKSKRKWNPGRKPLLTGGEMAAIAKAKRAAGRLKRAKKGLKKSARALEKAC